MSERLTTWNEMLGRVKRQAKDFDENARIWTDDHLKSVLFDAVKDLARDCPDALMDARGHYSPLPFTVLDWDLNLPTAPYYEAALEALCLYKLTAADSADVKDESRANNYLTRYRQLTHGGG